eukprot:CAMPEP_0184489920 /NCGR_PEP_ID=MMETSP0113_2-20130426/16656_1 /TAXON_ID=91329 /ORGANISM="Norrisiella sphaerica, Strain BC52" /LENGTH=504 /DNA_ID=CAMNT_0026873581 /DNA_START=30 /DNA_END=1544 /DNA_ORIENTATION=-
MSGFSGAVKLADINDFLAPSQACIKPQLDAKKRLKEKQMNASRESQSVSRNQSGKRRRRRGIKLEVKMDTEESSLGDTVGHFDQIKASSDGKTAKITLNDCLACSGCVTSAETVLINEQSVSKFEQLLDNSSQRPVVVSISPMSLAGLAVASKLSLIQTARRLATFFKNIGVGIFVDQSIAQSLSLLKARSEFIERYKSGNLPILCSECPGWICYAEKTQGAKVLKYLSNVQSPQQVMGTLIKTLLAKDIDKPPQSLVHCAIMPCYDKKLEASRDDFHDKDLDKKDVELVLTTIEIMDLIISRNGSSGLQKEEESDLDPVYFNVSSDQKMLFRPPAVGASGGYLENIFKYAAKTLFDKAPDEEMKLIPGKNPDIQEATLSIAGDEKLKFALAYGFRNIQNTMRKLKRGRNPYHYVEIMACPAGCANGGGQIKDESKKPRVLAEELKKNYYALSVREPEDTPIVKMFRKRFESGAEAQADILIAKFYDVSKKDEDAEVGGLMAKW